MEKRSESIRESQIEDALVAYLDILRNLLGIKAEVRLIGRQIHLADGKRRLDILLAVENEIVLVELKVEPFQSEFVDQVVEYKQDLEILQSQKKLVAGNIQPVLLVTDCTPTQIENSQVKGVQVKKYSPVFVLTEYFNHLAAVATFLKLRPVDLGVFNIGLINRVIKALDVGNVTLKKIVTMTSLAPQSIDHHLTFAKQIGLVVERSGRFHLTSLGNKYVESSDNNLPEDALSEKQSALLRDYVASDPFSSPIVFGIYSIVESSFFLARNKYPISLDDLREFFQKASGKNMNGKPPRLSQRQLILISIMQRYLDYLEK